MKKRDQSKNQNPLSRLSARHRIIDAPTSAVDVKRDAVEVDSRQRVPFSGDTRSYLVEETTPMERSRREFEQERERQFGRVNQREHLDEPHQSMEGEQNTLLNHPWLDNQRYAGVADDVNPVPPLNTEARREFDNALRLQNQLRNEKRNENTYQPNAAPKPSPG